MTDKPNYFNLFDLPMILPVDYAVLTAKYQHLQRQYHPDNFAVCPEETQRQAMLKHSADINQAYQTLKDPIRSADYFLSLQGIENSSEKNITHDPEFLQEQFELREYLDTIESLDNQDEKQHQLTEFQRQIKKSWQETYDELLNAVAQSNWSLATIDINKLRFLKKLQQDIERLEDQFFDL